MHFARFILYVLCVPLSTCAHVCAVFSIRAILCCAYVSARTTCADPCLCDCALCALSSLVAFLSFIDACMLGKFPALVWRIEFRIMLSLCELQLCV